ncbi:MAG: DUF3459 domain-containing protein [Chloroflexi bacterium]|nr:DUF3459 domain-containing protein [Chloroflexota bacterium]
MLDNSRQELELAHALLFSLQGSPFLYYGEELGMRNGHIPRGRLQDPPSKRYWPFHNRDAVRTPLAWDDSRGGGFTAPGGDPWLPLNPDHDTRNVAAQRGDPDSVLNFYRALLQLRRACPALRRGDFRPLVERPVAALAYLRRCPEQTLLVALNFYSLPAEINLALPEGQWTPRLSTAPGDQPRLRDGILALDGFEVLILERT